MFPANTRNWRRPFLAILGLTGNASMAARVAGVSSQTIYRHRASDPQFAAEWQRLIERDEEARRRAIEAAAVVASFRPQAAVSA
jgi:hypothetical protein